MWTRFKHWALLPKPHSICGGRKHALRFVIVLLFLLGGSLYVSNFWVFEYAGLVTSDALARLRPPEPALKTAVVAITAKERNGLLGSKIDGDPESVILSPIPGDRLLRSICSILRQGPEALGVDLDTSQVHLDKLPKTDTRLVWSQGVQYVRKGASNEPEVEPEVVLANKHLDDALIGPAVAPVQADWSVREIDRCYAFNRAQVALTFVGAITAPYDGRAPSECKNPESEQIGSARINYKYDRFELSDFEPDALSKPDLQACLVGTGEFHTCPSNGYPLTGKVVLLGGEYDPQDWHPTPFGLRSGVEVLAGMVEHVLRNTQAKDLGRAQEIVIKVALAFLIAFIHSRLKPLAALVCSVFVLGTLVFGGNVLAVLFTAYRATTVPFLVGIVIEQLYTSAERAQEGTQVCTPPAK